MLGGLVYISYTEAFRGGGGGHGGGMIGGGGRGGGGHGTGGRTTMGGSRGSGRQWLSYSGGGGGGYRWWPYWYPYYIDYAYLCSSDADCGIRGTCSELGLCI